MTVCLFTFIIVVLSIQFNSDFNRKRWWLLPFSHDASQYPSGRYHFGYLGFKAFLFEVLIRFENYHLVDHWQSVNAWKLEIDGIKWTEAMDFTVCKLQINSVPNCRAVDVIDCNIWRPLPGVHCRQLPNGALYLRQSWKRIRKYLKIRFGISNLIIRLIWNAYCAMIRWFWLKIEFIAFGECSESV